MWLRDTGAQPGEVVTAQTMYDLSRDWYRTRMDVSWEPPDATQVEALFATHGLIGPFWQAARP